MCMECVDECDLCSSPVCGECTFVVDTCKCCKQKVLPADAASFCVDCVMRDWFSKAAGFQCNACTSVCDGEHCKVKPILDAQTECPICMEPFDENRPHRMQMCDMHKVCVQCNYEQARGCPICRVGCKPI